MTGWPTWPTIGQRICLSFHLRHRNLKQMVRSATQALGPVELDGRWRVPCPFDRTNKICARGLFCGGGRLISRPPRSKKIWIHG
jgi:hypothetical protein